MNLFFLAIGDRRRASSRLRLWDHVEWFRSRGERVYADYVAPSTASRTDLKLLLRMLERLPVWVYRFMAADAIYIQETLILALLMPLRNVGKKRIAVYDFSDPIDVGTGLGAYLRRTLFRRMCRHSSVIICENPIYLEKLAGLSPTILQFYGPVDSARYRQAKVSRAPHVSAKSSCVNIGWTGSPSTVKFIAPLLPILDRIARVRHISLTLLGLERLPYAFEHLRARALPWTEAEEFSLVPEFDLGLFGLDASEHSKFRGSGKLFIYMAAGVPFIASNRGVAAILMRDTKLGFPADDGRSWEDALIAAIDDAQARERFSHLGMQYADTEISYERFRAMLSQLLSA